MDPSGCACYGDIQRGPSLRRSTLHQVHPCEKRGRLYRGGQMRKEASGRREICQGILLIVFTSGEGKGRCKMPAAEFLLRRAFCMTGLSVNVSRLMMCFIFMVRKQNKCDLIPMPVSLHYKVTARRDNTLFMLWENGTKGLSVLLGRTIWKEQPRTISRRAGRWERKRKEAQRMKNNLDKATLQVNTNSGVRLKLKLNPLTYLADFHTNKFSLNS
ncbi:uncharacterized protein LOC136012048 isoform X1 [Lathamus discolor]|uniref:uncharacterized protein LOC136012048 isoform X1 n=1 Tax=Lathamus discolor TaxID=678569 RepID=UPI0032B7009D